MTISKLCSGTKFSPFCTAPRQDKIRKFTPHYMAGDLSASRCGDIFQTPGRNASSNYGIGSDGVIWCYVDEDNRAWTSSSPWNDNQAITVEVANTSNETGQITDAAWKSLIKLATDVCHRYNFTLTYTGDQNGSLTRHNMFAATSCPGPWIQSHLGELANIVNNNLRTGNYDATGAISGLATGGGIVTDTATCYAVGINANILFSQESITPYVVTIDSSTPDIDYDKLKEQDVVGVLIDIGTYFDINHKLVSAYNPKLEAQIAAAVSKQMPFGFVTTVRSNTVDEVISESYRLKMLIRKYPPQLGVWLQLNLSSKKPSVNDPIIDKYYDILVDLGLYDQIGFYNKADVLNQISWESKYCNNWYWNMDRHLKKVDNIHNLPTPKFFMFKNPGDEEELIEPDFEAAANLAVGGGVGSHGGSKVITIDGVEMKLPVDWGYAHRHQSDFNGANWRGDDNVRGIGIFNCNEEGDGSSAYANSYALNVRWEYVWYTSASGRWPAHARYKGTDSTGKIEVGGVSDGWTGNHYIDGLDLNAYINALGKAKILCYNPDTGKSCVCASGFYAYRSGGPHNWGGAPLALLGGITTAIADAIGAEQNKSVLELYWVDQNTKLGPA